MLDVEQLVKDVYSELGPGYSERVYHNAMEVLWRQRSHRNNAYRGHVVGQLRANIIIDGRIILELKAIKTLTDGMELQARKYLDLTGLRTAYLVNFPLQPDREVEIRLIALGPSTGELSKAFGEILEHHHTVSADLKPLPLEVLGQYSSGTLPAPCSTLQMGQIG
mgnify:CR=1 FL=1